MRDEQGILTINAGQPCLEFEDIHSTHAHKLLKKYYVGELVEEEEEKGAAAVGVEQQPLQPTLAREEKGGEAAELPSFLDPHAFKPCPLIEKETVTHDTCRFRFGCVGGGWVRMKR